MNNQIDSSQTSEASSEMYVNHQILRLPLVIIVLLLFIFVGYVSYYFGKKSSKSVSQVSLQQPAISPSHIPTTLPTATSTSIVTNHPISDVCTENSAVIATLVGVFENLQKIKDAKGVLSLFTKPDTTQEISDYNNLNGNGIEFPRLYSNVSTSFNLLSYKVTMLPTKSGNDICTVAVNEQRSNYGGPANPQYLPPIFENVTFIFKQQDGTWLVDKYQKKNINTGKYSGWL